MISQISSSAEKYLIDYYMNKLDAKNTLPNSTMIISVDESKIKKKMQEDIFYWSAYLASLRYFDC